MNAPSTFEASLGEASVFEQLLELIEKHELQLAQDRFPLGNFYDIINNFDIAFQEFNTTKENDPSSIELYNKLLTDTLGNFLFIFRATGFKDEPFFYAFKRFITYFNFVLKAAGRSKSSTDILGNFYDNFPSLNLGLRMDTRSQMDVHRNLYYYAQGRLTEEDTENEKVKKIFHFIKHFPQEIGLEDVAKQLQVYSNDFTLKTIQWNQSINDYMIVDDVMYMKITIEADNETVSASKLLEPFYLIASALENIKGNTVSLENIKKGSLKADIKVVMKDLVAKEETKTVIDIGKEIAVAALTAGTVSYSEVIKNRKESKSADLEQEKLTRELNQMPSNEEVQLDRALETERKNLENEKLRLGNVKAQLEIVEALSGLVAKGVLSADMLKISINDVLFLLKENGQIQIGPNISDVS